MNIFSLVKFIKKPREIVLEYPLCHLNHNNFVQNECCKVYGVARINIFRYFDVILLNTRSSSFLLNVHTTTHFSICLNPHMCGYTTTFKGSFLSIIEDICWKSVFQQRRETDLRLQGVTMTYWSHQPSKVE